LASSLQIQGLTGELPVITKGIDDESLGISDPSRKKEEDIEPSKIMEERLPQKIITIADAEEGLAGEVRGSNEGKDDKTIQNKRTPRNKRITRKKKRSEKSKDEKCNKSSKSRKKTTFKKVDLIENDFSDFNSKYTTSEDDASFEHLDTSSLQIQELVGEVTGVNERKYDKSILNKRTPQRGNKQTTRNEEKSEKSTCERYDASSKITEERLAPTALVVSKWAEKESKSRKTPTLIEDQISLQEDLQILELSDDKDDSEHDMSDIIKKYSCSKTSFTEYDEEVMGFLAKCGRGDVWTCTGCTYSSKIKTHVKEHAEKHVKGYSLLCNNCGKVYGRKKYLRQHKAKCTNEGSEITWM